MEASLCGLVENSEHQRSISLVPLIRNADHGSSPQLNEEKAGLEAQLVGSPDKVRQTLTRAQEELK